MDCKNCMDLLDDYSEGRLDSKAAAELEMHLKQCRSCSDYFQLISLADIVIGEEKSVQVNPFLSTRVLSALENAGIERQVRSSLFGRILKPVLITVTISAALFLGVLLGSLNYNGNYADIPDEVAYLNDSYIESLEFFYSE